jgi:hypothetical protein
MTTKMRRQLFAFWIVSQLVALNAPLALAADPDEPIAYIGHGGFLIAAVSRSGLHRTSSKKRRRITGKNCCLRYRRTERQVFRKTKRH